MGKLVLLGFAFLGIAFYAMSDGASFDPDKTRYMRVAERVAEAGGSVEALQSNTSLGAGSRSAVSEPVTRVSLNLTSFEDIAETSPRRAPRPTTRTAISPEPQPNTTEPPQTPVASLTTSTDVVLPSIIFPGQASTAASRGVLGSTDIRTVTGSNVNLRDGPSTDFGVVDQLSQGEKVEVLDDPGNGWVRLRPLEGGPIGWMADFLLTGS